MLVTEDENFSAVSDSQ